MQRVIDVSKLENVLQSRWTEFIDKTQLMRTVMEHVRDGEYKEYITKDPPPQQFKLSLTKFTPSTKSLAFEAWAEFSVPKGLGVVVGTNIYRIELTGEIKLEQTYGTHFLPENP
jgi:hypothetical protein